MPRSLFRIAESKQARVNSLQYVSWRHMYAYSCWLRCLRREMLSYGALLKSVSSFGSRLFWCGSAMIARRSTSTSDTYYNLQNDFKDWKIGIHMAHMQRTVVCMIASCRECRNITKLAPFIRQTRSSEGSWRVASKFCTAHYK